MRRYVPELKNYSDKYIYEPWKAPIADQKKWGCVIKGDGGYAESNEEKNAEPEADEDRLTSLKIAQAGEIAEGETMVYPKPMFDFARQREVCISGLKSAYHIGLHGNSPKVLDGTWRELFDNDAEGPTEGTNGPPGAMVGEDGDGDIEPPAKPAPKHKRQREETPENEVAPPSKSPRTRGSLTPGRKGAKAGQATLDGHVKKMKP